MSCLAEAAGRAGRAPAGRTDRITARPRRRRRTLDSEEPSPAQRGPAAPGAEPPAHSEPQRTRRETHRGRAHAAPRPEEGKAPEHVNITGS